MPVFVAEYIEDLSWAQYEGFPDHNSCERLLLLHADVAVGVEKLRKIAARVRASGCPRTVSPRRVAMPMWPANFVWNRKLFDEIEHRLRVQ
jgi:hypothetical protein